jgi:hypothetical protein
MPAAELERRFDPLEGLEHLRLRDGAGDATWLIRLPPSLATERERVRLGVGPEAFA